MLHRVRKANDENHGMWSGVGGKFEPGETPGQCVLRETWEETGLTLMEYAHRGVVRYISETQDEPMRLFTAIGFTGGMIDCNEGVLEWVEADKLPELPMWAGDRVFLRLLADGAALSIE